MPNLPLNKFSPRGKLAPVDPFGINDLLQGGGGSLESILGQIMGDVAPQVAPPVAIEQQLAETLGQAVPSDNPLVREDARAAIPQDPTLPAQAVEGATAAPTEGTQLAPVPSLEETQIKVQGLPADFNIEDPLTEGDEIPGLNEEDEKNLFADFFSQPDTKALMLGFGIGLLKNEGVGGALERGVAMRERSINRQAQRGVTALETERTQAEIKKLGLETEKLGAETTDIPKSRTTANVKAAASLATAEAARITAGKKGEITSQDVLKTMTDIQNSIREAQSFGLDEEADALLDSALNINSSVPENKRHHLPLDAKGEGLVLAAAAEGDSQRLDELIVIYGPEALEAFATSQGK